MFSYRIPYGVATLRLISCDCACKVPPFVNVVDGQCVVWLSLFLLEMRSCI